MADSASEPDDSSLLDVENHEELKLAPFLLSSWDPLRSYDWDKDFMSPGSLLRIRRDMMTIFEDPLPGIFVVPESSDISRIHALITGPFDTPYEGGFFHFIVRCPSDYPIRPPRVKFLTTDDKTVRFNPNLYKTGKVCLSILGTWNGPSWSPALGLPSLLLSIQSLFSDKPYFNEPGFEKERRKGDVELYNDVIQHETLRVAVCGVLEKCVGLSDSQDEVPMPKAIQESIVSTFPQYYSHYEGKAKSKIHLDGNTMCDPFGEKRGTFRYKEILDRLQKIKERLRTTEEVNDDDEHSSSSDES